MDFTALRAALRTDTTLQELAKYPLTLNVMTWAYSNGEALPRMNSLEERRKHLFDKYIERMFQRRKKEDPKDPNQGCVEQLYHQKETMNWLILLARRMHLESQTIFIIEQMQPTWLQSPIQKSLYSICFGLTSGLLPALLIMLITLLFWSFNKIGYKILTLGLLTGVFIELFCALVAILGNYSSYNSRNLEPIKPLETLKWSWRKFLRVLPPALISYFLAIWVTNFLFAPLWNQWEILQQYAGRQLVTKVLQAALLFFILFKVMHGPDVDIEKKTLPNQGIRQSAVNAGIFGLTSGVLFALIFGSLGWDFAKLKGALMFAPLAGLFFGLYFGLVAGKACLQHFSLRIVLYFNKYIPHNYARFLNHATERIFLQKVGGGYIFIHRLLQDHFANL